MSTIDWMDFCSNLISDRELNKWYISYIRLKQTMIVQDWGTLLLWSQLIKKKQIKEKIRNIAAHNIQGCQRHNLDHIFYSSSFWAEILISSTVHIAHKHSEHAWLIIQRFMPCSTGGAAAIMVTPPFCLSTFSCQPTKEKTNWYRSTEHSPEGI